MRNPTIELSKELILGQKQLLNCPKTLINPNKSSKKEKENILFSLGILAEIIAYLPAFSTGLCSMTAATRKGGGKQRGEIKRGDTTSAARRVGGKAAAAAAKPP